MLIRADWRRWALAIFGFASLLLAACSSGSASNPTPSTGPVSLVIWTWAPGVDKAVAKWNQDHPNIQVTLQNQGSGLDYYQKLQAAQKAGTAPDLAQVEYNMIPTFVAAKALADESPYLPGDASKKFAGWTWQQSTLGSKHVFGIPQDIGPMVFFYRKDLFTSMGLTVPTTWDQYATLAHQVHAANKNAYLGNFDPASPAWFAGLAWQAGAAWFKTSGDKWVVGMNDQATQKVATLWQQMVFAGDIVAAPDWTDSWNSQFNSGQLLGWVTAAWGSNVIPSIAPSTSGKWAVAPMPQWGGGSAKSGGWGGSVDSVVQGSKHVREATEFNLWLNSDPTGAVNWVAPGAYPAAPAILSAPGTSGPTAFYGGQDLNSLFAQASASVDPSFQWGPIQVDAFQYLTDGLKAAVTNKASFVDALNSVQSKVVDKMRTQGFSVQ
jgi:multiple sugar transport system substrate-binding protein